MIRFQFASGDYMDIAKNASLQLAGDNPIFNIGSIPGERIYTFKVLNTPNNQRNLGWQELLNLTSKVKTVENVSCFIHKHLWKKGSIRVKKASDNGYDLSFHVDTASIALQIKNKTMPGVNLGNDPLLTTISDASIYPAVNHILLPVWNPLFYGDTNSEFSGIVNDFENELLANSNSAGNRTKHTVVPFPYLLYVLDRLFKSLGYYGISGTWTENEDIRRVAIYNTYALDDLDANGVNTFGTTVTYSNHMPNIGIGKFLVEVGLAFGIQYDVDTDTNTILISEMKEVFQNQDYLDFAGRSSAIYNVTPNDYEGIRFQQIADSVDSLFESDKSWMKVDEGDTKERIELGTAPLLMSTSGDGLNKTIPKALQEGISAPFDLQNEKTASLRFIIFKGMVNSGFSYPQGHYENDNISLRPGGATGIVNRLYRDYIDFKTQTEEVTRDLRMTPPEFFTFNFKRKLMTNQMKYLVKSYKAKITKDRGLQPVSCTLMKTIY
ncbi:MAG: hypothetical protein AAGF85_00720 [Bacteroidota bacterium]